MNELLFGWLAAYVCVALGTLAALEQAMEPRGFIQHARAFFAAIVWPVLIPALIVGRLIGA